MSVPSSGVLYVAITTDGADLAATLWVAVATLDVAVVPVAEAPPPQPARAPAAMARGGPPLWVAVPALGVAVVPVAEAPPPQPASAPAAMASAPIAHIVDIRFTFIPLVGFVRAHDARRASLRRPNVVVRNVSPTTTRGMALCPMARGHDHPSEYWISNLPADTHLSALHASRGCAGRSSWTTNSSRASSAWIPTQDSPTVPADLQVLDRPLHHMPDDQSRSGTHPSATTRMTKLTKHC